jgi:hypothetical protein
MNTFIETLKSIALTQTPPAGIPATDAPAEEHQKFRTDFQAYEKARKEAKKIRVFTTSREYIGIVTKVADDHFVINDEKHYGLRVLISKVEAWDFPGPRLMA